MPSALQKKAFSGSSNGNGVVLSATTSGGANTIHTAVSGTTTGTYDEIYVYACNTTATPGYVTIAWGNTPDYIAVSVPAYTVVLVVDGWILQNSYTVKGFCGTTGAAGTTNSITVEGWVNAITN